MKPEQALQLLSDALEPKNINLISRQGYIAIQEAIEVLAKAIIPPQNKKDEHSN